MEKMVAAKPFNYRQVDLKPGEEFDCEDEHVTLFTLVGFATKPEPKETGSEKYLTRVMSAGAKRPKLRAQKNPSSE